MLTAGAKRSTKPKGEINECNELPKQHTPALMRQLVQEGLVLQFADGIVTRGEEE